MQNAWMLDVLTDLGDFADQNGLQDLAGELRRVRHIAERELAGQVTALLVGEGRLHAGAAGTVHRAYPGRHGA